MIESFKSGKGEAVKNRIEIGSGGYVFFDPRGLCVLRQRAQMLGMGGD